MNKRVWLAFVLSVASVGVANAQSVTTTSDASPAAPIHVERSYVRMDHTLRGGYALPDAYYECVSFANVGDRRVTGIDFSFAYMDAQGRVIGNDARTRTGRFEPGAATNGRITSTCFPFIRKPHLATVRAHVGSIAFADGTHWPATAAREGAVVGSAVPATP